jgi:hypothetical protein
VKKEERSLLTMSSQAPSTLVEVFVGQHCKINPTSLFVSIKETKLEVTVTFTKGSTMKIKLKHQENETCKSTLYDG